MMSRDGMFGLSRTTLGLVYSNNVKNFGRIVKIIAYLSDEEHIRSKRLLGLVKILVTLGKFT
jgi:hypothetical protein